MPIARRHLGTTSPVKIVAPAEDRLYVLNVPFMYRSIARQSGAKWDKGAKAHTWRGQALPSELQPFASQPYSFERWREDDLNNLKAPSASGPENWAGPPMVLRDHQKTARDAIAHAIRLKRKGAILCDETGLGKSASGLSPLLDEGKIKTILIVCTLSATAHWRATVARLGDRQKRIVIITYERLSRVVEGEFVPCKKRRTKKPVRKIQTKAGLAKYGTAISFDAVLMDESHKLRNIDSTRSKLAAKVTASAKFVLYMSATAGQNPLELSYLAPLLCAVTGERISDLRQWEAWCAATGFAVTRGDFGKWTWGQDKDGRVDRRERDADLERMRALLFEGNPPLGLRRTPGQIQGWPEILRIPMPVELGATDRAAYAQSWEEFRESQGLRQTGGGSSGLAAQLRFRQKSSLLRTQSTVDYVSELLEKDLSVAVSVSFTETLDVLRDCFQSQGHPVSVIHGRLSEQEREQERLRFQKGDTRVCIYTVTESISLHQGEYDAEGSRHRANVIHDLRWSAIETKQIEGRCHRDGKHATTYWLFAEGTVEQKIVEVMAERMRDMSVMKGDAEIARAIEEVIEKFSRGSSISLHQQAA